MVEGADDSGGSLAAAPDLKGTPAVAEVKTTNLLVQRGEAAVEAALVVVRGCAVGPGFRLQQVRRRPLTRRVKTPILRRGPTRSAAPPCSTF
mmetsp:Transcript_46968/g.102170  ORF Transcript_46968/g.102170 Transcript_46968/m.102170 type:complete len:92 (-) Transcript_46968:1357-1632(-)